MRKRKGIFLTFLVVLSMAIMSGCGASSIPPAGTSSSKPKLEQPQTSEWAGSEEEEGRTDGKEDDLDSGIWTDCY